MYEKGNAKIIPSILSSKPPWPGIIFPVSFIFDNLLNNEIIISPNWLTDDTKKKNISFKEVMDKQLKVMDLTAFQQCQLHNMPIRVFNIERDGALPEVIMGKDVGTLVS